MRLGAEALALLPYRVRPGVYDVDSREGRALLNLYAWAPDAHGAPRSVIAWGSRKPQAILGDGRRLEWSPKDATRRWEHGEEPAREVLEAVAVRHALAGLIRSARTTHTHGGDPYGVAVFVRPYLADLWASWVAEHAPEFRDAHRGGLILAHPAAFVEFAEESGVSVDITPAKRRWVAAASVVRRPRRRVARHMEL